MDKDRKKENNTPILFGNCKQAVWVIGYGGGGKSTLSQVLQEEYGYTRIELGAMVNLSYKKYVSEWGDRSLSMLDWLRREIANGEGVFSYQMLRLHLEKHPQDIQALKVVIPSMRTVNGLGIIKSMFPYAKHMLIYVKSSREKRADRISKRALRNYGLDSMAERDNMEDESGIKEVIKMADAVLENDGDLDAFMSYVRAVFSRNEGDEKL